MLTATDTGLMAQMFGHRHIRFMVQAIVLVLVVSVVMLFMDWGLRSGTMPIEEVTFKGRFKNITHTQLENVVAKHLKNNFLVVNLETIQIDIEKLPWIYRASVRRKWPSGLYVEFMEQEIVARWGKNVWLNSDGDIVNLDSTRLETEAMPFITGPEKDSEQLLQIFKNYQQRFKNIGIGLNKLIVSKRGSYRLITDTGIEIILGKHDIESRIKRFLNSYQDILARHQGAFSRVDLRYTNGFAVLWNETASNEFKHSVLWGTYVKA